MGLMRELFGSASRADVEEYKAAREQVADFDHDAPRTKKSIAAHRRLQAVEHRIPAAVRREIERGLA